MGEWNFITCIGGPTSTGGLSWAAPISFNVLSISQDETLT
jgi:hypothetical protein